MKKIMNDPLAFVDETLEGIILAHSDQLRFPADEKRGIIRKDSPVTGKVAIATGGGSGHLPVFLGFVGKGLADGASVGNVFTSPSADSMFNVAKEIHGGQGILFLYGNYYGDKMNFDLAAEMLEEEDIRVETVRVADDAASASSENRPNRRGVAGIFFAYKIAGACAETRAGLSKVKEVAEKTVSRMATMGVALSSCVIPASGKATFSLEEDEMELGMGIHGEPGIRRSKMATANEICESIVPYLFQDLELKAGEETAVLVNGSGATPLEELYIVSREAHRYLTQLNIKIHRTYVGEFATSLEMAGCSITLLKLDDELKGYLDASAASPFFKQFGEQ